jgi:hypothetical protein
MVVHLDSNRISRVRSYSGYFYQYKYISNTGLSPSMATLSSVFSYANIPDIEVLQPPDKSGFGLVPFHSSLLRESQLISFLRLLRYFNSPTSLPRLNGFGPRVSRKRDGFLHSDISGSQRGCSLPEAYRKLQRPSSEVSVKGFVVYPLNNFSTQT